MVVLQLFIKNKPVNKKYELNVPLVSCDFSLSGILKCMVIELLINQVISG